MFHKLHIIGMNDNLWDRVLGSGSETWEGFQQSAQDYCKCLQQVPLILLIILFRFI